MKQKHSNKRNIALTDRIFNIPVFLINHMPCFAIPSRILQYFKNVEIDSNYKNVFVLN